MTPRQNSCKSNSTNNLGENMKILGISILAFSGFLILCLIVAALSPVAEAQQQPQQGQSIDMSYIKGVLAEKDEFNNGKLLELAQMRQIAVTLQQTVQQRDAEIVELKKTCGKACEPKDAPVTPPVVPVTPKKGGN